MNEIEKSNGGDIPAADNLIEAVRGHNLSTGECQFPVVGLGASAGGLDAFRNFLQAVPPESGMAYVLVQHLDPTHESMMTDLLTKYTSMRVVQIEDNMPVARNSVYMIPPNKYLFYKGGRLFLTEPIERRGMRMPIDFFFRSLAEELHDRAICVVLSGTGSDGTAGLRLVKAEGGTVFAQDPSSAQYDGMPKNAIATGNVDFILAAEDMPKALIKFSQHTQTFTASEANGAPETASDDFRAILAVLQARTHHDFRCYKRGTLARRIHRRMVLRAVDGYSTYLDLIREDPAEVKALLRDLLIGVTAFFRDPDAWKELDEVALSQVLSKKGMNDSLRVWVAGCSSGEEAYSLAILISEIQARLSMSCPVQIFASDIDEEALEVARTGIYPESIASDITPERLGRFFETENGRYRVKKKIRDMVVFASQNLVRDPPFSKLDLISCRNLLIYLGAPIQKQIFSLMNFALVEGGYLFLGLSESISQVEDLFETVAKRTRIYRRIGITTRHFLAFPLSAGGTEQSKSLDHLLPREPRPVSVTALAHEILLREYVPASAIVNRRSEAIYYHGPVSRYLEINSGEPTRVITDQAREGLGLMLRSALQHAIRENQEETLIAQMREDADSSPATVRIIVRPLKLPARAEGLLLITFEDVQSPARESPPQ